MIDYVLRRLGSLKSDIVTSVGKQAPFDRTAVVPLGSEVWPRYSTQLAKFFKLLCCHPANCNS
jgi:hypothetical protein